MPSFDVTLPRSHKAVFPDKCIVCHGKPDRTVALIHGSANPIWIFILPVAQLFTMRQLKVPICMSCRPGFVWNRFVRTVLLVAAGVALFFLARPYIEHWPRIWQRLLVGSLFIGIAIPYFLLEARNPPAFDVTRMGSDVDYEFRSEEYAREFRELNAEA